MTKDNIFTQVDSKLIGDWYTEVNGESAVIRIISDGQYLVTQHYPSVILNLNHLTLPGTTSDLFTRVNGLPNEFIGEWKHVNNIDHLTFKNDQTYSWDAGDGIIDTGIFSSNKHPLLLTLYTKRATLTTNGNLLIKTNLYNSTFEYYYEVRQNRILLFSRQNGELAQSLSRI